MPPSIRLPDSLGLDASGIARRAAEWIRWYLELKKSMNMEVGAKNVKVMSDILS